MGSPDFTTEAVALAEAGFRVFPLKHRGKEPATGHGFKDATGDPQAVAHLWASRPNSNIGIATGGWFMVLDVDMHGDVDGGASLREWEREHGDLPETVCAETGSGGEHLWFRIPEGVTIGCAVGVLPGVDVRGDGGYIVAPPSIHPNGSPYVWQVAPGETDMATMPPALVALCTQGRHEGASTRYDASAEVIPEGGRDTDLFKFASKLRGASVPFEEACAACVERGKRYVPPLPKRDLIRKVEGVYGRYPAGHASNGSRGAGFDHVSVARAMVDGDFHMRFIDGAPAVWAGDRYNVGREAVERAMIQIRGSITDRQRREVFKYLALTAPRVEAAGKHLVAFKNGLLNTRTMELEEPSPQHATTNVIPHDWNPSATDPVVSATLAKVAGGDLATLDNLLEVVGLTMTRDTSLGRLVLLVGEGSNGKSSYLRMIENLLGRDNVSTVPLQQLAARFQTVPLMGKLANIGDDISSDFLDASTCAIAKQVVFSSTVSAEMKGAETFGFRPYCTLIFSCNDVPRCADVTEGFRRRLLPIPFTARFSPNDADFDPRIEDKLATENALEALAVLGVEAWRRACNRGCLTENELAASLKEEIDRDNDTAFAFVEEEYGEGAALEGQSTCGVYRQYTIWCEDAGCRPLARRTFTKRICSRFGLLSASGRLDGDRVRVFQRLE